MTPDDQRTWLLQTASAASRSAHVWPQYAACEAAIESGFGQSGLARMDNNLFGMKQHKHAVYGTHNLPTKEFENGEWITTTAAWVSYPDVESCFADRMATLNRLASTFPHYAAALDAKTGEDYVREVSQTWSTDPQRADKVLRIYGVFFGTQGANV